MPYPRFCTITSLLWSLATVSHPLHRTTNPYTEERRSCSYTPSKRQFNPKYEAQRLLNPPLRSLGPSARHLFTLPPSCSTPSLTSTARPKGVNQSSLRPITPRPCGAIDTTAEWRKLILNKKPSYHISFNLRLLFHQLSSSLFSLQSQLPQWLSLHSQLMISHRLIIRLQSIMPHHCTSPLSHCCICMHCTLLPVSYKAFVS